MGGGRWEGRKGRRGKEDSRKVEKGRMRYRDGVHRMREGRCGWERDEEKIKGEGEE